jgi:hypothetical protein
MMLAQADAFDDLSAGEAVMALLLALFVFLPLCLAIGAVILRIAARWVAQLDIPFGSAMLTVFLTYLANLPLSFLIGFIVGTAMAGADEKVVELAANLVALPLGVLLQGLIIGHRHKIGFGKGVLVVLGMIAIAIALAILFGLVVFVIALAVGFLA